MKLTDEQVQAFREDGVIVVDELVTDEDLAPVIREIEEWIDRRALQLQDEGKITDLHADEPFERRFASLYAQTPEIGRGMDIMEQRGPQMFAFLRNDNILDAMESLIGPEITCNPIQHLRGKPPLSCAPEGKDTHSVPWHQDSGVTWVEADDTNIITCWIALADATEEKGCMQVLPGVWQNGHLEHQKEGGTTIRPDLFPNAEPRPVPVKKGGAVIMHRYTPHKSTANLSDEVRWSLDLRYQPTGLPTGRPFHPEFVARSRKHPESVLTDHDEWRRRWIEALEKAKGVKMHRV